MVNKRKYLEYLRGMAKPHEKDKEIFGILNEIDDILIDTDKLNKLNNESLDDIAWSINVNVARIKNIIL